MGVNLMSAFYYIKIGNCERQLKLIKTEDFSYYSFNMLGDVELNKESAKVLANCLTEIDVIVTVESKAIALAQEISSLLNHSRYVVIRKSKKSYMENEVSVFGKTIISGNVGYYLDGSDINYLRGKRVAVVDDVISSGGTIDAIYRLLDKVSLNISLFSCVLCEGKQIKEFQGIPVISHGFIPFLEKDDD